MVLWLATRGETVNRKRVPRWRQNTGIQGIVPGPRPTVRATDHKVYPYLLQGVEITRPILRPAGTESFHRVGNAPRVELRLSLFCHRRAGRCPRS